MLCKCGSEIHNVPEHLRGLASWMCQKCTNTAPKGATLPFEVESRRMFPRKQRKEAA